MEMPTPDIMATPAPPIGTPASTPNPLRQSGTSAGSSQSSSWENLGENLGENQESQVSLGNIWESIDQYTDESSHLFSLYLSYAEKHDKELAENWIAGADGILVFTGLFAATLATFVVDSYKSLLPDSGNNTVALLTQISQQLSNASQLSTQASVPSFHPPTSAIWVNALWFLSLLISLFCALLATLQQSWARRYLRHTHPKCATHKRARLRSFFAEGVERFHLAFAVETIPALLHISMFLFSTGLVISLFAIHHTIAFIILAATIFGGLVYILITVMPVIYHNSPYQSPLSVLVWDVPRRMVKTLLSAASYIVSLQKYTNFIRKDCISSLSTKISKWKKRLSVNMARAAEISAAKQHWSIDARALSWTLDKSDEESELERFIAGIPKFTRSKAVEDPLKVLKAATTGSRLRPKLYRDITTMFIKASDPDLIPNIKDLPEPVRQWRIRICSEALYFLPHAIEKILARVSKQPDNETVKLGFASVLSSEPSWNMALRLSQPMHGYRRREEFKSITIAARCMAAVMATRLPDTMSREILERQMGIQNQDDLDRCLASRGSFLLKNLNHFLGTTALKFIHVEGTDILLSTVTIIKQVQLQLDCTARELLVEFGRHLLNIKRLASSPNGSETVRKNAKELLSRLSSLPILRRPALGSGSPPTPPAQTATPTPPNNDGSVATVSNIQFPLPQVSSPPPPGDVYISIPPYPGTPSGETHPLMTTAYPEPPHSATLPGPTMPMRSRDNSSGDEESVE